MVLIGRNDPKFIFGFNNNFSYKNFDLNIYMYGQVGKIAGANSYYDAWGSYGNRIKLGQNVPVSFTRQVHAPASSSRLMVPVICFSRKFHSCVSEISH